MLDKFSMTREQSIFFARRNIVDYIWKSAKLEGLGVTFPQTDAIFNGYAPNVPVSEVIAINNLKRGWQFVLSTLDYPLDYTFVCQVNRIVGSDGEVYRAGYTRMEEVRVSGTGWTPSLPEEEKIKERLAAICSSEASDTEKALAVMLYLMRQQCFSDGNKRTAMLVANQMMISTGRGVISIGIEQLSEFRQLLVSYYESGDMSKIKRFLYDNCIDGTVFRDVTQNDRFAEIDAFGKD